MAFPRAVLGVNQHRLARSTGFLLFGGYSNLIAQRPSVVVPVGPAMHTNVPGCPRSKCKSSSRRRATEPLSKRTDFNSAMIVLVSVVPGLSWGSSPGDTERDSGYSNQHLLPAHGNLPMSVLPAILCRCGDDI